MHKNAELVDRLYHALAAHDHNAMAECYHPEATFEDIAFKCDGKEEIHDMWRFVTRDGPQLKVHFEGVEADDVKGRARLIDDYIFTETGRPVHNVIDSTFTFKDGLIFTHRDSCDPIAWANMAMTGAKAWMAGHFRPVRSLAAKKKLQKFLEENGRK